ncbi:PqqD family protein [Halobacteriovorax vibrionivorans]|uniref:PqqD family protein n=2 Tax=Halobacteriovoraceae TaxID=1652132 RepID=A0ABY0IEX8_9BACT|nr:PqqD family protein [Halobacteriovorax vibrionivorans]
MEVLMFIKRGSIQRQSNDTTPILINPQGKRYEVSFLAAFIWDHLDGRSPLQEVVTEVQKAARIEKPGLYKVAENIVSDLKKVDLITETSSEMSQR